MNKGITVRRLFNFLTILIIFFSVSCSPTKYLKEGEYLLKKNYPIEADDKKVMQYYPEDYIRQKPNKKIFGIALYARIYNLVDPVKQEKREEKWRPIEDERNRKRLEKGKSPKEKFRWTRWLRKIGEEPVVYNQIQTRKSSQQITTLLKNKGYFNAQTFDSTEFKGKYAHVKYKIKAEKPYTIRNYTDSIEDPNIVELIKNYLKEKSKIEAGENVDVSYFDTEREKITELLLENGYYRFSKDYIFFKVDTFIGNHQADIQISVKSPVEMNKNGEQVKSNHKKYFIKDINIYPDYEPVSIIQKKKQEVINYDTVPYEKGVSFMIAKKSQHTKAVLTRGLTVETDSVYRASKAKGSFTYYSSLSNFRLINFDFAEPDNQSLPDDSGKFYLSPQIKLTPLTRQSFTIELEGNTTSGKYGMASNLLYRHLNLFGGAEILDVKFKVELNNQDQGAIKQGSNFSETEYGVTTSIRFPNLLMPFSSRSFYLKYYPKTAFSLGYNFRYNASYRRSIFSSSYGYDWRSSNTMTHLLNALEFSSVKLTELDRDYLNQLYESGQFVEKYDHMILGSSYAFTLNTQNIKKSKDFHYLMFKIEPAGNLLYLLNKTTNSKKLGFGQYMREALIAQDSASADENIARMDTLRPGFYTLFNLPYAQYFKGEIDFRYYQILNSKNEIVYRINPGIIVPYGNSFYSPQEKRFYLGGSSSMRAWQPRLLGPGSFQQGDTILYQYGDIKLEMNLEYRFKMFWVVEGALFVDAGNIWSMSKYEENEQKKFHLDNFYKEIAIGTGMGLRLDFSFFIFRFDFGFKIHDPSADGERWFNREKLKEDWTFNFGIGYPF